MKLDNDYLQLQLTLIFEFINTLCDSVCNLPLELACLFTFSITICNLLLHFLNKVAINIDITICN